MFFITVMTFVDAWVDHYVVTNTYRFNFGGGIQIGVYEICMFLGLFWALFRGATLAARDPVLEVHPAFKWSMGLLLAGTVIGFVAAIDTDATFKDVLSRGREYISFPLCMYLGYRLVPSKRAALVYVYMLLIAGIGCATVLLAHFGNNAEEAGLADNMNAVRTSGINAGFAAIACAVLVYALAARVRILPQALLAILSGYCFIGACAPLHRSMWLGLALALASLIFLLPVGKRLQTATRLVLIAPILLVSCFAGIHIASKLTQRDFADKIEHRLLTMLPGDTSTTPDEKAWTARLTALPVEGGIWLQNPLMGKGFAADESHLARTGEFSYGNHHNGWISVLAENGPIGLAGLLTLIISSSVVGYRLTRASTDRASILIGVLGFLNGPLGLLGVASSFIWTTRNAVMIAIMAGITFRLRDRQLTQLKLGETGEFDPTFVPESQPWELAAYEAYQ